ncbi:MAG: site-specific DNA-methyltransferase [Anaerolineae bacterium]|nr:site-specific DNA-methyltransferase [Anaerolineae bacterium]
MTTNIEPVAEESVSMAQEQLARFRELFPEVFSEGKVDLDKVRATLGDLVDEAPDRYSFGWAGKRDAIRLLQMPSRATLIPDREASIAFDETQNMFIEGDNLEVLKLLYKSYFNRVKLIYIDPPYNTGNDFIYKDDFTDPLGVYLKHTAQQDSLGNLLRSNPDSSGRFHSAWLSMMYPRLFIARQLLREDGVIAISINDDELPHLRLMMNEIFGNDRFIGTFVWKSRHNVDSRNKTGFSSDHEYILIYGRQIRGREIDRNKYTNPDNDHRGPWMSDNMLGLATAEKRPNLHYDLLNPETGINYGCPQKGWRYNQKTMSRKIVEGRILWPSSPDGRPREKKFLDEINKHFTGLSSLLLDVPTTSAGTQEVRNLFGADVFDFPKPVGLLKLLIQQTTTDDDIILDFFAGSCPTAQAVMELNRAEQTTRRFILVQLPEPTQKGSPAQARGFKTISEIGQKRIRLVSQRLQSENEGTLPFEDFGIEDTGFRAFKLAESHIRLWRGLQNVDAAEYAQQMALFIDPLLDGWQTEPLIYEVAIREGFGLNCTIAEVSLQADNIVYRVTDPDKEQQFHICLDAHLSPDPTYQLGLAPTDLFICRDVALDDKTAANIALQCRVKTI